MGSNLAQNKLLDTTVYIVLAEQESIGRASHKDVCKPFAACTIMVDIFISNYINTFKLPRQAVLWKFRAT
jgi:hypothetical protein